MKSLRRLRLLSVLLLLCALPGLQVFSQAGRTIGGYEAVSEVRIQDDLSEYTYRATLSNNGAPISGATATLSSQSPDITVVDSGLTFGPAATGAAVMSSDTFSVRHDRRRDMDWSTITWTLTTQAVNRPPIANAGPDQTVPTHSTVTLNGSGSTDADGNSLTYKWALISRPAGSNASLKDPTDVKPSLDVDVAGSYLIAVVVNDGIAQSAPDTVTVSTTNSRPVSNAGRDQTVARGTSVRLDGSGSTDADGNRLQFAWSFMARPSSSAATLSSSSDVAPTFTADAPGRYVLQLIVSDGAAASAPSIVIISTANSKPVADAGTDQTVSTGTVVALNGSGSTDADGDSLSYAWSFASRPSKSSATLNNATAVLPTFTADAPGTYVVQLIVTDGSASSAPDNVVIATQNSIPVANPGPTQSAGVRSLVLLDGAGSSDVDGDSLTYQWAFTTQPAGSAATLLGSLTPRPSFVTDVPGTYVVQLIVNDGATNSKPATVTVTTLSSPPTADAGPDQLDVEVDDKVTLSGSSSINPVAYAWSFVARPDGSQASLDRTDVARPTFTPDQEGDYVLQLVVSDGHFSSKPDTVLIRAPHGNAKVTVEATDPAASETGPDTGTFTVSRSSNKHVPLTVLYSVTGTATNGTDYVTLTGSLLIPAGEKSATLTVTPIIDGLVEGAETVVVTVLPSPDYRPENKKGFESATVTITDGAATVVSVAATDAAASEAGSDPGTFTFTRTGSTAAPLVVSYSVGGTATNGTDYTPTLSGSITIPAGQASATATIAPVDDAIVEGSETAIVTLTTSVNYSIAAPGNATVTIADNDVPSVTVSATDATASETGPDSGTFTFTRTGPTTSALVVLYSVSGSATNGTDYTPTLSGSITIPVGQASATATITPVDDSTVEGDETAIVTLTANAAYSIVAPGNATVTIADNDVPAVSVAATDAAASETGPDPGTFTFTRTGPTTSALVVLYNVSGTATNGTDYTPTLSGSITISAGQASATAIITPVDDALIEGDETAIVTLTANVAYTITAPGNATVTIADNDVPAVSVAATDAAASETGPDPGTFTFTRTGPTTSALVVLYNVSGTATNGTDYTPSLSGSITIPAGQASATAIITPVDDALIEGDETAIVTLTANVAYTIAAPGNATVTIADNDVPAVSVAATDAAASETGPDPGTFTFTRTGPTTSALVVLYSVGGTATNGTDYTPSLSGSITIPAGQASATAIITPVDDALIEGDETAIVTLTANVAYTITAPGNATVTIADNDVPAVSVAATDAAASETGPDPGTFTFTRTGPTTSALVVQYSVGGTATNGTDYTPSLSGSITIPAGQASATATITPVDDALIEGDEAAIVTLTANVAYTITAPGNATVTIADNDVPAVSVAATDAAASETGPDPGTFTFTRTGPTTSALVVQYSVGGTATNGTDYTPTLTGSITIPAGQASATTIITPVDDALIEGDETAIVTLTANVAYTITAPGNATVIIADNDVPAVSVAATDAAASETGPDPGTFTFTRTGPTTSALVVLYSVGGTATNGTDYTPSLSGSITIPAGQASATAIITPVDDALIEGDETAIVTLTANVAYTITAPGNATVTIADNDVPAVSVAATDAAASETGPDPGTFTFTRTGPTTSALVVLYSVGGTATNGTDYTTLSGSITIPSGQASATATITPVDDALIEGSETAIVTLTANAAYTITAPGNATVTIADNDVPAVSVAATDAAASETGPDPGTFTFTRTGPTTSALVVLYSVGGTATNGTDYTTLSGSITIPSGQASATATITPVDDALIEGDETAIVTLTANAAYTITAPGNATVTIADNDVPAVSLAATDAAASETGPDPGTFTFTRTGPTTSPLVVLYNVSGSATNGTDYTPTLSGSITIPAGQASATAIITPVDDALIEGDETAIVTLTANVAYTITAPGNATVTIADNDVPAVSVAATDAAASETGPDPGTFTFTRTGPTTSALVVLYSVSGTATNGTDYTTLSGSITIPSGQASATATITPVDDALIEGSETAIVTLTANAAYTITAPGNATVTIADNDVPAVSVAATDAAASETGPDPGTFTFTRTGPTTSALVIQYSVSGTATNGTDYTPALSSGITIPAGQSSAIATITPVDDATIEGDETATVTLTSNAAYTIVAPGIATITIADNDVPVVSVAATDATASETGPDPGTFTFSRTGPTTSALVVQYSVGGTATNGTDYTPTLVGSITIPVGQASATATITPVDDSAIEGDETAVVTLTANAAYTIAAPGNATVTISDNDVPVVTVTATDATASETGPDPGTFTFSRTGPTTSPLAVFYSVSGSANNGGDFTPALTGTITIPSGQSSASAVITPVDDSNIEGDETAVVTLTVSPGYTVGASGSATITITDNDVAAVTVAATDAAASESGPDSGAFTFSRTGPTTSALVVSYSVGGTANNINDYTPQLTGLITIPAGQSSATATITPLADNLVENPETVIVTVLAGAGYSVGAPAAATVTIADNPPMVTLTASDPTAAEAGGETGTFSFSRTGGDLTSALTVNYTISGTATNSADYALITNSIQIPANAGSATVTVSPLADNLVEPAETVILTISSGPNFTAVTTTATVTIADDPPVVQVAATDPNASETGPDPGVFTFSRTGGDVSSAINVFFTRSGTATEGTDYVNLGTGSVTIGANQVSANLTVTPIADALAEPDETVIATISANAGYVIGASNTSTVTIHDAAAAPLVSVTAFDASASETGPDPGVFRFTRTGSTTAAMTVTYSIGGTATNGTDYVTISGSINIPIGQATADLTITPITDALSEGSETVQVTVTDGAAYDVGSPATATVTIEDTGSVCGPEGGPLTNGFTHCGTIGSAGEIDTWTFTANTGDRIGIHIGEVIDNNDFRPWIRVIAPNGTTVLANTSGVTAAAVDIAATATGTYQVLIGSFDSLFDGTGTYRLTMTHTPGPITISVGDEGGPLTNGAMHTGSIFLGDLDVWTFTANAGDRIGIHIGQITDNDDFRPWIRLWAPNGAVLGSASGTDAAALDVAATVSGTYLVLVASFDSGFDGTGTYRLTETATPGPITVSPGDQGGPLTNGATHTGEILKGDLDVWTFSATIGDRIGVHIGEITDNDDFRPWIRIWAPNGAVLGDASGTDAAALDVAANATGNYLVLVGSFDSGFDGTGTYQMTMTHTPGPITISPGDEGGPLTNGAIHTGEITQGDLDVWTFTANAGDRIGVHIGQITETDDFRPWIRIWAPNGAVLGSASGTDAAALDVAANVTGNYLVLVGSFDSGFDGTGTYRLTMTHTPGPITVSPSDEGGPLTNGATHTGEILKGDLDVWTFSANLGDRIGVHIGEITDNDDFRPWIRIGTPNGAVLGDASGTDAAALDVAANATGVYLVLVSSFDSGFDGTGTYQMTMTHTPGPITVTPGDDGGPLTNGAMHTGEITQGDLDVWTFTANAGDRIGVHIGEITETDDFRPWIRIWAPNGAVLGNASGVAAAELDVAANVTGTYLVLVGSFDSGFDGTGTYRLTETKTPGPITVSAGDQGGPLTNGATATGEILRGDLDVWTFTATQGDRIAVHVGQIVDNDDFRPWIRIWAPNGVVLGSTSGTDAATLDVAANVTGTYLVLVSSFDAAIDGTGTYQLTMAHTPGPITISPGDEGGAVTLGVAQPGTITPGDLDVWTVSAIAGEHITVNITEVSETNDFRPWIRLWSPTGAILGNTSGLTGATIASTIVPTTGTYLILVGSFDSGFDGSGTYNLTVTKP